MALMYILSTGCQWRAIAKDLPPRSTLYDYFDLWGWDGTLDRIHYALERALHELVVDRLLDQRAAGTGADLALVEREHHEAFDRPVEEIVVLGRDVQMLGDLPPSSDADSYRLGRPRDMIVGSALGAVWR